MKFCIWKCSIVKSSGSLSKWKLNNEKEEQCDKKLLVWIFAIDSL